MILELDCGNTLIKWRVLDVASGQVVAAGASDVAESVVDSLVCLPGLALRRCRLVSVRGEDETARLVHLLETALALSCCIARPAQAVGVIRNGYDDFALLGLDRWLAVVGAYTLAGGACLVLDLGTAVTADYIDASGLHVGGYICPGLPLMSRQLQLHTQRIRYAHAGFSGGAQALGPGHNTRDAVERGCIQMLRGFAHVQRLQAREYLGDDFQIYLTGGDASLLVDVLPTARMVPDLVFVGLGVVCP